MKNKLTSTIVAILTVIVLFVVPLTIIIYNNESNASYYLNSGWNCDNEKFKTFYSSRYSEKISELKALYDLHFDEKLEVISNEEYDGVTLDFSLYCEEYTILFRLESFGALGTVDANVYYFCDDTNKCELENIQALLSFTNDFINYVSFDSIKDGNELVRLFVESKSKPEGEQFESNRYHYDSVIGNVGYYVSLIPQDWSYYYMTNGDEDIGKYGFRFGFEGLLQPLD